MFKTLLVTIFIIAAASPIFAIIAVRDTTPVQVCDTLIDKNGVVSPVKIVSIGTDFIQFKQCSPTAKKTLTIERSKIREIKVHTFAQAKPVPLLKRAKRAFRAALISTLAFFFSILLLIPSFEGDSGDKDSNLLIIPEIAVLVTPFVIVGSFLICISLLDKAKKAKDEAAAKAAIGGIIIALIPILLVLRLFLY